MRNNERMNKLRDEIQQRGEETITYEMLNSLSYLKNVLRESKSYRFASIDLH